MKKLILSCAYLMCIFSAFAQTQDELKAQLERGKQYLAENKYGLALETFKPISDNDTDANVFRLHAAYLGASAAFKNKDWQQARIMLTKINAINPNWSQIDEANYLSALVYLEEGKYAEGISALNKIQSASVAGSVTTAKKHYFELLPLEKLQALSKDFPNEETLKQAITNKTKTNTANSTKNTNSTTNPSHVVSNTTTEYKPVFKKEYHLVVAMPFMSKEEGAISSRKNQYLYDFYAGLEMGVAKLQSENITLKTYIYDIEKDASKVSKMLSDANMKNTDVFLATGSQVNEIVNFAKQHDIAVMNPIANNTESTHEKLFFFQPSYATQAEKCASYMIQRDIKEAYIICGDTKRDSLLAYEYKRQVEKMGGKVKSFLLFENDKDSYRKLKNVFGALAPTKKAISAEEAAKMTEEELKKYTTISQETKAHIFVASSQQTVAINLMSILESGMIDIPMIATRDWLNFQQLSYESYELRNIMFIYPEYADRQDSDYQYYVKEYVKKYNMMPSEYAMIGYESAYFLGKMLHKHGKNFLKIIQQEGFVVNPFSTGVQYELGKKDNQIVPLFKLRAGHLENVNKEN